MYDQLVETHAPHSTALTEILEHTIRKSGLTQRNLMVFSLGFQPLLLLSFSAGPCQEQSMQQV
jgi:hypothetical protein